MRDSNSDLNLSLTTNQPFALSFTISHVLVLNSLLPSKYSIELTPEKSLRTVFTNQRKPEVAETPTMILPVKRKLREKDPDFLSGKSESFKKCYKLLQALKHSPASQRFLSVSRNPVENEESIGIILIESKLMSGEYLSAHPLIRDLRKLISQQFALNCKSPAGFKEVFQFAQVFENLFKGSENLSFSDKLVQDLGRKIESLASGIKEMQKKLPEKSGKDKKMTKIEKKQLCVSLQKLDPKCLNGVLKIVKGGMEFKGRELEFDLEKLPNSVCRELEKYIKQCLQLKPRREKGKSKAGYVRTAGADLDELKSDQRVMKSKSESSFSSSSSSESEDELPGAPLDCEIWDKDLTDFPKLMGHY